MPHLSHSQVTTFLGCSQRWAYSRQEREPSGCQAVLGQCVHHALETALRFVADGDPLPDLTEVLESFWVNWDIQRQEPTIRWYGKTPEAVGLRGQRMLEAVYEYLPLIQPKSPESIEQRFEFPLAVPGWTFTGLMDVVSATKTVIDYKTTGTAWDPETAEKSLQVPAYYLGYEALYGEPPAAFTFLVVCSDKNGPADAPATVQVFRTTRTPAQVAWYWKLLNQVAWAIDIGALVPNPTYQWCGPRSCHWWAPCQSRATDQKFNVVRMCAR